MGEEQPWLQLRWSGKFPAASIESPHYQRVVIRRTAAKARRLMADPSSSSSPPPPPPPPSSRSAWLAWPLLPMQSTATSVSSANCHWLALHSALAPGFPLPPPPQLAPNPLTSLRFPLLSALADITHYRQLINHERVHRGHHCHHHHHFTLVESSTGMSTGSQSNGATNCRVCRLAADDCWSRKTGRKKAGDVEELHRWRAATEDWQLGNCSVN